MDSRRFQNTVYYIVPANIINNMSVKLNFGENFDESVNPAMNVNEFKFVSFPV